MGDHEMVEIRHPAASSEEDREATLAALNAGLEESGIGRRPLIRNTLLGALGLLGLPAVVLLRDLGPLPGDSLEHTIWDEGMRVVRDVIGTPIRPADLEIGDLVNAEPEALFPHRGERLPRDRGRRAQGREGQGRGDPAPDGARRDHPGRGPRELVGRRHRLLLQDLHPRRLPDLALRAAPPTTCSARATSRPSTSTDSGQGHLRAGRPRRFRSCRSRWTTRATSSHRATSPNPSDRASGSVTPNEQRLEQGRHDQRRRRLPPRRSRARLGAVANWADERLGPRHRDEEEPAQGLPRPLVLHARRDRAVELRRPAAHRRLPDAVVQAEHGRGRVRRLLRPAARHPHVRGVRLHAWTSRSTSAAAC